MLPSDTSLQPTPSSPFVSFSHHAYIPSPKMSASGDFGGLTVAPGPAATRFVLLRCLTCRAISSLDEVNEADIDDEDEDEDEEARASYDVMTPAVVTDIRTKSRNMSLVALLPLPLLLLLISVVVRVAAPAAPPLILAPKANAG
jgi:hypothetical protein